MFHLAAFASAKTDSTANEALTRVPDPSLSNSGNNNYLCPWPAKVWNAIAYNDTITRARIVAPSLRTNGLPEIFPLNGTAAPSANFRVNNWGESGPTIQRGEEFGVEMSNGASTSDFGMVGLWLRKQFRPAPPGERFTVRGTSAQTLVLNTWTLGGITLDQSLPQGRYAVIGMQLTCTSAYVGRLVFTNDQSYRPGVPAGTSIAVQAFEEFFRFGSQGEYGRFDNVSVPNLELLGQTAGAQTAAVILDLVRLDN